MSEVKKVGFGYKDDNSEDLQSKSGGKFGLNVGYITNFSLNTKAGKDETEGNAIDVTIKIVDREYRTRFYEVTKVYNSDNVEITDTESEEYINIYNREMSQLQAVMTHIVKCFNSEEVVKAALSKDFASFQDWANTLASLVPSTSSTTPLHVFLEYQWTPSTGQTMTFLQLPKNMKGGRFLSPMIEGNFEEVREEGALHYVNEKGERHPFERSENYMGSNKAIQQGVSKTPSGGNITGAEKPKGSTW